MTAMKGTFLSLQLWIVVLINAGIKVAGEDITINPWHLRAPNLEYDNLNATVGDTITFLWSQEENHTVYINPTGNCDDSGALLVGDSSPVSYTFTEADAEVSALGDPVFFADNIEQLCEWGMRFTVEVFKENVSTDEPTDPITASPTVSPTDPTTASPTASPTANPTNTMTETPTANPTASPTASPTISPTVIITDNPTVNPTATLSLNPTEVPTTSEPSSSPTMKNSSNPSSFPSVITENPSMAPSQLPTLTPTTTLSDRPTLSKSGVPSTVPSSIPTDTPSEQPSNFPSVLPSVVPTPTPSQATTGPPISVPTPLPTIQPTKTPTTIPTDTPTATPTTKPSVTPTATPTQSPTKASSLTTQEPSVSPEKFPTNPPGQDLVSEKLNGLMMGMAGISELSPSAQNEWQELTASFSTSYVFNELKDSVSNFVTKYEVTNVTAITLEQPRERSLRGQRIIFGSRNLQDQEQGVIIEYAQTIQYATINSDRFNPDLMATAPFSTDSDRTAYVTLLKTSSDSVLTQVKGVSAVQLPEPTPTQAPTLMPKEKDTVLTKPAIIGIACGGAGFLILIVIFICYCRSGNDDNTGDGKAGGQPPLQVDVRDDEISTLAGPTGPPTYGDQSVATMDYDYSKAYGGAGDTSVSSAGGTFGSNTQNVSYHTNATATGAALGAMDDDSYNAQYDDPRAIRGKEEVIHIFAPPGKLGVVIDTPDDGAPVVHAVKDTSVIADRIIVGDKLVAVDDEDVTKMTAIKVSKMISRKGSNPSRKLTIVRTLPGQ